MQEGGVSPMGYIVTITTSKARTERSIKYEKYKTHNHSYFGDMPDVFYSAGGIGSRRN